MTKQRNIVSLCSGALGLDLGFEQVGTTVFACDNNKNACETIKLNRPNIQVINDDLRNITLTDINCTKPWAVLSGFPCQSFSTMGKRKGLEDDRGNVFLKGLDLIFEINPEWIVLENVRGILNAKFNDQYFTQYITNTLTQHGYQSTYTLYDTSNFQVPQKRERVVFIASKTNNVFNMPSPNINKITFQDATKNITEHHYTPFNESTLKYIQLLSSGENWRNLPEQLQQEAMGGAYHSSGGRTGFYRRLCWNKPSPTLMTSPTQKSTLLAHPEENRPLSIQEYKRLQTFPDDWQLSGSLREQYKMIGNAVPVKFAQCLAQHLVMLEKN